MATGIVLSLTPAPGGAPSTSGQVQQDETGDIFNFQDTNFPNTGLKLNGSCTFDLIQSPKDPTSFYATNLAVAPAPRLQTINGPTGDITALVGDVITITSSAAVVNGTITISGGKVVIDQNATVNGPVNVNADGIIVAKGGGSITGNIGMSTGGSLKVVKNGSITGNVIASQAGRIIVGNQNGPGFITGTLDIQGLRDLRVTPDSKIVS
jgi:hypothetical protein